MKNLIIASFSGLTLLLYGVDVYKLSDTVIPVNVS